MAPPSSSVDVLSQYHFYPPAASSAASSKRDCSDEHDNVQGEEERSEYSVSIIEGTVGEEGMQEAVRNIHQMTCFNSLPHPCATFTLAFSLAETAVHHSHNWEPVARSMMMRRCRYFATTVQTQQL